MKRGNERDDEKQGDNKRWRRRVVLSGEAEGNSYTIHFKGIIWESLLPRKRIPDELLIPRKYSFAADLVNNVMLLQHHLTKGVLLGARHITLARISLATSLGNYNPTIALKLPLR